MIRLTTLTVALALVAGAAHAATISTGNLQGDGFLNCAVSNVGDKDAKITSIRIFNAAGVEYETQANTCGTESGPAALGAKATCAILLSGETYAGHCEVEGTGKLRVSLQAFGYDGLLDGALTGSK